MTATTFLGALTGNVTGTVSGNAGTVTNGVYTTDAGTVTGTMILDSTVASADIAADTIVADDIATGAVTTTEILDSTVASADIAANTIVAGDIANDAIDGASLADTITLDAALALNDFDVTIEEDLNVNGDEIDADGTLDITGATGMNINTGAGDITLDPAGNDVLPGGNSQDNLGADATRWSAIYADTLNYTTALTDDNSAGTTVSMGDSVTLDSVTINANTAITDGEWSVTNAGVAAFASTAIGGGFGSTGVTISSAGAIQADDTITATGIVLQSAETITNATNGEFTLSAGADTDIVVTPNGTGDITLGDADSDVTVASGLTVTAGGATITAGGLAMNDGDITDLDAITTDTWGITDAGAVSGLTGITSAMITDETIVSADIDDGTIAGGDLAANIAITTSGTLTSTGTVDFSGASLIIDSGTDLPGTCVTGQLFVDTDAAAGSRLMVCIANAWSEN